jgi:murein DD-endopeptidase MepM/ murein hydrolase activator NlpD
MNQRLRQYILTNLLFGALLASCNPMEPTAESLIQATTSQSEVILSSSPIPSALPSATSDPVDELLLDLESTPVKFVYPTPMPNSGPDWRPPPYEVPLALRPEDHFYFKRPIPSGDVNWPNPSYRYGNTFFADTTVHTGVDLGADQGADVVAAGDGEIIWVGYGLYRGFDDVTDPYGLAIAIRHDFGHVGKQLYTIYAHLEEVFVWLGQQVKAGETIGSVGITGHTTGPHLHFEIRLGNNDYYDTRNPELWMAPPEGWAVLAGKVMNSYGHNLTEHLVEITSLEDGTVWNVRTYRHTAINSDDEYNENFVISDLPSGPYEIRIIYYGVSLRTQLFLYPGRTNFIEFFGWKGYTLEDAPTEVELIEPPIP